MKTKLIFLILALSLFAISCDNSEEKRRQQEEEQQRIEEEKRKKLIDAVTKDLKSKEWVATFSEDRGDRIVKDEYIMLFANNFVRIKNVNEVIKDGNTTTYISNKDAEYTISNDGKTVTILVKTSLGDRNYQLRYSKTKLEGIWENKYLYFLANYLS